MTAKIFKITHKDKHTKARIGIIKTKSGEIETPFFMPVATKTAVKYLSSKDLEEIGANAVISNTFVLHLKPGEKIIKKLGGIKKFMNYKGINVTDSGGFQMYSPSLFLKSEEKGVLFKNPRSGSKIFITPEEDMRIQLDLNSDIAMCLDSMPLLSNNKKEIKKSVELTTKWAERCKKHHEKLQKNIKKEKRQLLFSITQGGIHKDLRKLSSQKLKKLDFDGYAIGGLALGETNEQEMHMIKVHKSIIDENKPCYLMGAGNPYEVLEAISLGCDMFDSRFPTQNARHGTLFTSKGKLKIFNAKYKTDPVPIDKNCKCKVCKTYSRAYIKHLLEEQEGLGYMLATYHNIWFMTKLIEQAKLHIKQGSFHGFLIKMKKMYK